MKQIIIDHPLFGEVPAVVYDGKVYYRAINIARAMGYPWTRKRDGEDDSIFIGEPRQLKYRVVDYPTRYIGVSVIARWMQRRSFTEMKFLAETHLERIKKLISFNPDIPTD
ncbi:MAG: hypothetical protein LUC85_11105 [Bacteroidales bacterium]|nr:hypothetical protein [Bacteroidales bacterium]MCD8395353.1 hypothetical protein [Bacteroidales bacterium]